MAQPLHDGAKRNDMVVVLRNASLPAALARSCADRAEPGVRRVDNGIAPPCERDRGGGPCGTR